MSYAYKFTTKVALTLMNMILGLLLKKIIPLHLMLKLIPKWCLLSDRGEIDFHLIAFYFVKFSLFLLYTQPRGEGKSESKSWYFSAIFTVSNANERFHFVQRKVNKLLLQEKVSRWQ